MTQRTLLATLSLLMVLALAVAGCAAAAPSGSAPAASQEQPAATDGAAPLVVAIAEDTASLDPARAFETLPSIIHKATYDTLVTFPPDSVARTIPSLAKEWTISEDGLTYTFTLDERAKFADGSPVTAADVPIPSTAPRTSRATRPSSPRQLRRSRRLMTPL